MSEKLEKAHDSVKDEKTFLDFLKTLAKDCADDMEKEKFILLYHSVLLQMVGK